ncbi:MAG: hypothetical protein M1128_03315 [Candidatus Marsarchaeota archaeon]|nr:hypothetical protein [Candidatus Marsarchaeota archaeon]
MVQENSSLSKKIAVFDIDGALLNDIEEEFGRHFIRKDSKIERSFKEAIFSMMRIIPNAGKGVMERCNALDCGAVEAMKLLLSKGFELRLVTSNQQASKEFIGKMIADAGINASVKLDIVPKNKAAFINSSIRPEVVFEDQYDVAMGISARSKVFLVLRDYNRIGGRIAQCMHSNISFVSFADAINEIMRKDQSTDKRKALLY